jgi:hypothetical protein
MGKIYLQNLVRLGVPLEEIHGVDIQEEKLRAAQEEFSGATLSKALPKDVSECEFAIVATNTPGHHTVIESLVDRGMTGVILCEKPLGLNIEVVQKMRKFNEKVSIYTAFLMNFSPALLWVLDKMEKEDLILTEASVTWGKNRFRDSRPTPGDLEDESVHGAGIIHALCNINQRIREISISAVLTYPRFINEEAQKAAHRMDPSFPLEVNASTMVLEQISTDIGKVSVNIHSSFVSAKQERVVRAVLAKKDQPNLPQFAVELRFDEKGDSGSVDIVLLTELATKKVQAKTFACNKIKDQTIACLSVVHGKMVDPRLVPFEEAANAVAFTEAVLQSHRTQNWITIVS